MKFFFHYFNDNLVNQLNKIMIIFIIIDSYFMLNLILLPNV